MIGLRFLLLDSADFCGTGTRDEPLRTSRWEANPNGVKTSLQAGRYCLRGRRQKRKGKGEFGRAREKRNPDFKIHQF